MTLSKARRWPRIRSRSAILGAGHIRFTYAANDDKTAKRISDLLGQGTERKLQRSFSGSGLFLTNRSESEQEYARPLLTPAEVNQLSQDDGILLVGGLLPYRARKVRYFLDPRFRGRDGLPPPNAPEEQARELLGNVRNDWTDALAPLPHSLTPNASAATTPACPTPDAVSVWDGCLPVEDDGAGDNDATEDDESETEGGFPI